MTQDNKQELLDRKEFEKIFTKHFPKKSAHRKACEEIWQAARAKPLPLGVDAPVTVGNEGLRKALEIVKNNYPFMRFEDQDRSFYVYDIIKKALQQPAPSADGREEE